MSIEGSQSFRVVYDEEKNKYYRMNKITGEMQPSYKTGKLPARFDPQVSGADYNARRKLINPNQFGLAFSSGKRSNLSYYIQKPHTQSIQKSFRLTKQGFSNTQPVHSSDMKSGQSEQLHNKKIQHMKSQTTDTKPIFRRTSNTNFIRDERSDTFKLFPTLSKPSSFTFLEPQSVQKKSQNSSIYQTIEYLDQNAKQKCMDSCNETIKYESPIASPKTKLSISFAQESLISHPDPNRLQSKLRRYCEIQSLKTYENNYQPLQNDQKSQRFQKFAEKSLMTSILDDSRLSSSPSYHKNSLLPNGEMKERQTVSRNDIAKSFDTLEKENASILLLANKCKKISQFQMQKSPKHSKKSPQARNQLINLQSLEQQQKFKSLIGKEKQMFLSFYPKYTFKQNARLIQQQKDRKINLKRLEQSFLENGERRFGKIYHSRTQEAKEMQ